MTGALLLLMGLLLFGSAPAAGSAGPVDRAFPGGAITQLAINDGPTLGSFANLGYEYKGCGKAAGETSCTWRIDVGLTPEGAELCPSASDPLIWSSGEQAANGVVSSGPRTFALRGTPGQVLCIILHHTSSGEHEGWPFNSGGTVGLDAVLMGPELISPIEALERRIISASTAATPQPPPHPPPLIIGPDCRTLTIGSTVYTFVYRRLGCRKAGNLASMAYVSRTAPAGYHCAKRASGGKRCWRQGHPRKYLEWHFPRIVERDAARAP